MNVGKFTMTHFDKLSKLSPETTATVVPKLPFAKPQLGLMLSISICSAPTTTCAAPVRRNASRLTCVDLRAARAEGRDGDE